MAFICRLIGPNWAVPAISAGGAVAEPLPSISMLHARVMRRKPSPQSVIRLFIVSEPMLFRLPDTPLVFW